MEQKLNFLENPFNGMIEQPKSTHLQGDGVLFGKILMREDA